MTETDTEKTVNVCETCIYFEAGQGTDPSVGWCCYYPPKGEGRGVIIRRPGTACSKHEPVGGRIET